MCVLLTILLMCVIILLLYYYGCGMRIQCQWQPIILCIINDINVMTMSVLLMAYWY